MLNKVVNLIKEKTMTIPLILLKNYRNLKVNEKELIVLIYLINDEVIFNPKKISKELNIPLAELMDTVSSLIDKDLLKIELVGEKIKEEHINLDSLYTKLGFQVVNTEEKNTNPTLYDVIEKEFGRTLSPMEYEIIGAWQNIFDHELIVLSLKEAVYNGVNNLRYIDKILHVWQKKGIKSEKDVIADRKNYRKKQENKQLFDYDWLNERNN